MDNAKLLKAILKAKGSCPLTISGTSMMPILHHGQEVTVIGAENISLGDILVYEYKNEGLLAHRLLNIENGRFFCKGDNSFRVEDVTAEQIVGKIRMEQDWHSTPAFLESSYAIGRLFRKCGYDIEKTKAHPLYAEYHRTYLENEHDKR